MTCLDTIESYRIDETFDFHNGQLFDVRWSTNNAEQSLADCSGSFIPGAGTDDRGHKDLESCNASGSVWPTVIQGTVFFLVVETQEFVDGTEIVDGAWRVVRV
ncbi:MAG: hypothetical protein N2255_05025 [Kiritimatiellae bacterium]|nr:hypothetical protein [Kiritimatiellia bacterium]